MNIYNLLKIIVISAVPLIEQRGSIPVGILLYKLDPLVVFAAALIGSFLPVPFILLFFNSIFAWMKKQRWLDKFNRFIERKLEKNSPQMERYKEIGLIIFIAIPLPTTGLWTGSAVASFLRLDFKKSLICAALGGIISAAVITLFTVFFPALLGY